MKRFKLTFATFGAVILLALGGAAVAALGLQPPVVPAVPPKILVSNDGVNWDTQLSRPIFSSDYLLVPGENFTESFWIQNASQQDAVFSIQVGNMQLGSGSQDAFSLSITPSTESSVHTIALASCAVALRDVPLKQGESVELVSTVNVSPHTSLEARGEGGAVFDILTALHGAPLNIEDGVCLEPSDEDNIIVDPPQPPGDDDVTLPEGGNNDNEQGNDGHEQGQDANGQNVRDRDGSLALTGVFTGLWILLAAALTASGLFLAARKRRQEQQTEDDAPLL
ncbi:hypothetical protein [Lysinibacter sp. HNR]|uniref:hypothetical protein n=1 Tax=Lysinibacter sp. HNR TaxID=3031408 RepID=UPI002435CCA0|nr:hypothetical protein [Lysinibacter sp. HNR]WGD37946.1 hypothetical protein FrondiHNR_03250 [Lysinibacter sp. HNR]